MRSLSVRSSALVFWAAALMCSVLAGSASGQDTLSVYQKDYLEKQITVSVNDLFSLWEEERFADGMYALGSRRSQQIVSVADFADRMNRNLWIVEQKNSKVLKIEISTVTLALVHLEVAMVKKNNKATRHTVNVVLAITQESADGVASRPTWRFNLVRLMALPYLF